MSKIKHFRRIKNLTQKELAKKTSLSQSYINELENGKKKNPSTEVLCNIAKALGVTVSEILEEEK